MPPADRLRVVPDRCDDIYSPRELDVSVPARFRLDDGSRLPDAHIRVSLYGHAGAPIVAVAGGISATRRLCGDGGWWSATIARGGGVDLDQFQALGFDFAPTDDARVAMSPDAQARLLEIALDALQIETLHSFVGASYGAMVGLALASRAPGRAARLCVISAAHRPAPMALARRGIQRRIVEFALAEGKAAEGLSLARQLAMTTYRSEAEFNARFTCLLEADGRADVDHYLISRGASYAGDIGANRWLSLSEAIDRHNLAPETVTTPTTLVASASDQLAPLADMSELAGRLPNCQALHLLNSIYGHDAFLKEARALNPLLQNHLGDTL